MNKNSTPKEETNNSDLKDVLKGLMEEHYRHIRHYNDQRSTVSNSIILLSVAILGIITFDKTLSVIDLPLTFLLAFIGVFGAVFCMKHFERTDLHYEMFAACQKKLDAELFDSKLILPLKTKVNSEHEEKFPRLAKLPKLKIHKLWVMLHSIIAILGIVLTILILCCANAVNAVEK